MVIMDYVSMYLRSFRVVSRSQHCGRCWI